MSQGILKMAAECLNHVVTDKSIYERPAENTRWGTPVVVLGSSISTTCKEGITELAIFEDVFCRLLRTTAS